MSSKKQNDIYTIEINNYQEDKKIKISPFGEFTGMDGRIFNLSESTLVKTKENTVDIPLNVEHGYTGSYNARAVGWISLESLETKEDGVYGTLTLNKEGKKLIDDKSYRYLSPEFILNQKREIISIEAIALTNTPNLELEINQKQKEKEVSNDTNEKAVKELNEKIATQATQLDQKDEAIKVLEDELKEQSFNSAVSAGRALPKDKEFAMSLNKSQLKSWIDGLGVGSHMKNIDPQKQIDDADNAHNKKAADMGWA